MVVIVVVLVALVVVVVVGHSSSGRGGRGGRGSIGDPRATTAIAPLPTPLLTLCATNVTCDNDNSNVGNDTESGARSCAWCGPLGGNTRRIRTQDGGDTR